MHEAKYLVELGSILPKGPAFSVAADGGLRVVVVAIVEGAELCYYLRRRKLDLRGEEDQAVQQLIIKCDSDKLVNPGRVERYKATTSSIAVK